MYPYSNYVKIYIQNKYLPCDNFVLVGIILLFLKKIEIYSR